MSYDPNKFVNQFTTAAGEVVNYHVSTVAPARVVPGNERHSWKGGAARKPGTSAECEYCGAQQHAQHNYITTYSAAGSIVRSPVRPSCDRSAGKRFAAAAPPARKP
jgi:hypothetical protein